MKKSKCVNMNFIDITPNVRYANLLHCSPGVQFGPRMIYDYQFIYVHKGKGTFIINNKTYHAISGDLFFYGPGVEHNIIADNKDPFLLSGLHLDFTSHFTGEFFPIGSFQISEFEPQKITEIIEFNDFSGFAPHINLVEYPNISEIFLNIVNSFNQGVKFYRPYINGLCSSLLSMVAQYSELLDMNFNHTHKYIIDAIITYIHKNYNRNIDYKILGQEFHFHPNHINRLIQTYTGFSLHQYIINIRVKEAMNLLMNSDKSISAIAYEVGYSDISYFTKLFKRKTGYTPSQLRGSQDKQPTKNYTKINY